MGASDCKRRECRVTISEASRTGASGRRDTEPIARAKASQKVSLRERTLLRKFAAHSLSQTTILLHRISGMRRMLAISLIGVPKRVRVERSYICKRKKKYDI